jgi:hypothetical protein
MKEVKETNSSNAEEVAGFARIIVQICMKLGIIASLISIIVGAYADRQNKKQISNKKN